MAYSGVLLTLLSLLVVLILTRKDIDATILRTPGLLYQQQENNMVSNLYNIKLINKTQGDAPITLRLESAEGKIKMVGKDMVVKKESKAETSFFIILPKESITKRKTNLYIGVYSKGKKVETVKTSFLGPVTR
jgi:hypothetical protein